MAPPTRDLQHHVDAFVNNAPEFLKVSPDDDACKAFGKAMEYFMLEVNTAPIARARGRAVGGMMYNTANANHVSFGAIIAALEFCAREAREEIEQLAPDHDADADEDARMAAEICDEEASHNLIFLRRVRSRF